jgi:hypothetical protein
MDEHAGSTPTAAASQFPGYVEGEFSTADQRYFYKESKAYCELGSGGFAVVHECVAPPVHAFYCHNWVPKLVAISVSSGTPVDTDITTVG